MNNLAHYWKAVVAVLGAVVAVGNAVAGAVNEGYGDGTWDTADTLLVVIAFATAMVVYAKANA